MPTRLWGKIILSFMQTLLDHLPRMSDSDRVGWDPTLMSVLSACVIQERFGLGSESVEPGVFVA